MTTSSLCQNLILQDLWENIQCSPQERLNIGRAIDEVDPSLKVRRFAALLPLEFLKPSLKYALKEELLRAWNQVGPFGQIPMKHAFVIDFYVASEVYPDLPIKEALRALIRHLVAQKKDSFFVKTFLKTNEHDFGLFLQSIPSFIKLYSNVQWSLERRIILEQIDHYTYLFEFKTPEYLINSYILPGMFEGFLDLFQVNGSVESQIIDVHFFQLTISWQPHSYSSFQSSL